MTAHASSKPFYAYDVQFIDKNTAYIIGPTDMYRAHFNKPPRCQSVQLIQDNPSEPLDLNPTLTWHPAPACVEGYRILIGTTPYTNDLYNVSILVATPLMLLRKPCLKIKKAMSPSVPSIVMVWLMMRVVRFLYNPKSLSLLMK